MSEVREHPGYFGAFCDGEAPGAIRNGSTIVKRSSEPGDANPDGSLGTVLGSVDVAALDPALAAKYSSPFFYFVEWQSSPRVAVGVAGFKIVATQ